MKPDSPISDLDHTNSSTPFPPSQPFITPDGMTIHQYSASETKYVYEEIFHDNVYFRHGIDLLDGETVFDIGANIGLFTIFVKKTFENITIHAFEPCPPVFNILKANISRYGSAVVAHQCGMTSQTGEGKFTFYPNYSIMSGLHAGSEQDKLTLRNGIKSRLTEQNVDPEEIHDRALDRMVKLALGQKQEYLCKLNSVSEIMDQYCINKIGLLKIDAEGNELPILSGIHTKHWPLIRQIVMELHDPTGNIRNQATTLLESHGFTCLLEEESKLRDSGIVNCYAIRK